MTELVTAIRAAATAQAEAEHPEDSTPAVRELAAATVELREQHDDMAGRTWRYRQDVRQAYLEAGVSNDRARSLQAAVRYHTGALIRAAGKAPEGWLDESPRERSKARRAGR